jgi:hypothetical protein
MKERMKAMTEEKKEEKRTMWDDLDAVMMRAKKICPEIKLPKTTETMETGLYKIIDAMNKLCEKHEKPTIFVPGR